MNVRIGNYVGTHQTDAQAKAQFNQQIGMISSALEHAVPEQMFTSAENPGEAVSAVKAIAKAQAEGQRIYHITPQNQASVLPNLHHDAATMDEIKAALAVGKEVTTHTDPISVPGWSGAGYIIMDPETGIGAYKIGGGMNGSFLFAFFLTVIGFSIAVLMVMSGAWIVGGLLFAWEFLNFVQWIKAINSAGTKDAFNKANIGHSVVSILGVLSLGGGAANAARWFGILFSWILVSNL